MNQYKVKLRGEAPMIVIGNIVLFKQALPINKKEQTHYFNADDVVYIIDMSNDELKQKS